MRVSVIIPTYNRWPKVRDAIDSVLAQSVPTTPIVVDDCSTDGSADKLAEAYGSAITLIRQPVNKEKSAARNAGISEAESEFLCFLDSDDTFTPNGVERLLETFDSTPDFDGVSYGACTVGGEIEIPPDALPSGHVLAAYLKTPFLHTLSFMIRKSRLTAIGRYREDLFNMEDVELFIRLMARMEFIPCGAVVADIAKQADSASANFKKIVSQGTKIIDYLKSDEVSMKAMGEDFELIRRKVHHELARALYKSHDYTGYCKLYETMKATVPAEFSHGKHRRRYWLARLRRLFQ